MKIVIGDCELYLGDCREILPTLGKVDAIVTDPPFGIGNFVQTTGRLMGRGRNFGKSVHWNESPPNENIFIQMQSMSKHRIIWGANFFNCFEDKGGAIVWIKKQLMPNFSKAEIASCTHFKKTEIVEIPWTNFEVAAIAETDHPCERPIELYKWCIRYLPNDMNLFLDPYMGSGGMGVASVNMGKRFIGIEINPLYFDMACRRIEKATRDMFIDQPEKPTQGTMNV